MEPQKYTKREKDSITLFCPVKYDEDSTSPTEILWYKDSRPIDGLTVPNIKVSEIVVIFPFQIIPFASKTLIVFLNYNHFLNCLFEI